MSENTCVCCGKPIPEGRMTCPTCEAEGELSCGGPKKPPRAFPCSECGEKVRIIDNVFNQRDKEFLRKRKCSGCGRIFYTVEFAVPYDETFTSIWNRYHRAGAMNKSHR